MPEAWKQEMKKEERRANLSSSASAAAGAVKKSPRRADVPLEEARLDADSCYWNPSSSEEKDDQEGSDSEGEEDKLRVSSALDLAACRMQSQHVRCHSQLRSNRRSRFSRSGSQAPLPFRVCLVQILQTMLRA